MATEEIRVPSLNAMTPGEVRLLAAIPAFIPLWWLSVAFPFRGRKQGQA
jgi:hypothetical protein